MAKKVTGYIKLQIPAELTLPGSDPVSFCFQWFSQCRLLLCSHSLNRYGLHTNVLLTYTHLNP